MLRMDLVAMANTPNILPAASLSWVPKQSLRGGLLRPYPLPFKQMKRFKTCLRPHTTANKGHEWKKAVEGETINMNAGRG